MIKAVIFDMDGLMIDSERVTYEGYVIECKKLGLVMEESFYKEVLGRTVPEVREKFRHKYGESFPMDQVVKKVHKYMDDRFVEKGVPVKRGLPGLLQYLKGHEIRTVVATSSGRERVDRILAMAGLEPYFDDSICGDEVKNGKPDPEVFLKACDKAGVSPQEALVLEDSEAGIKAAYRAGIPVICVPDMKYPDKEFAAMASRIVGSLEEVLEMFEKEDHLT
ncbi:MAG: HAD family phosphatase [Hungatella sp.]|jgi:HAD superfamily hydrolase (TIGR01509 family)|nr:HAD family phosphatase [Hungatella sp.]